MKITIIGPGKLKERYLKDGIAEFVKRLTTYTKLEIIEVSDEKCPENLSPADMEIVKKREGARILSKIHPSSYIITLELEGKQLTSEGLANKIEEITVGGYSHITFIIGGSLGLHSDVRKRSHFKLCFSKMTFPHQMMKLILIEQIYRSFRILKNEPYHK
ncbi:23S rRNA (pseudouridine(1915)-N(3))-methyltransferase RlmH [Thiospirochaeta perfilievii]|uniref:Ribosomal RNA large subunit methyltransferase H n=1 Tax=Thiospirochaeta perfilievii TaxID=252967 RepID=A0A5C1Q8U6_9SPIO|nr:23S rRNA (pseudouridine(1915)-N(3))-methyltransferase RlmH [Thiospirochaeta perfilievii]QEN04523.1 23S rRNA (pseudouridine(1915)-N(3))-methyltransferase RlmH [Thiospirochaeta perfilievii]